MYRPREDIRVMRSGEDLFELLQLVRREGGAVAALLPLGRAARVHAAFAASLPASAAARAAVLLLVVADFVAAFPDLDLGVCVYNVDLKLLLVLVGAHGLGRAMVVVVVGGGRGGRGWLGGHVALSLEAHVKSHGRGCGRGTLLQDPHDNESCKHQGKSSPSESPQKDKATRQTPDLIRLHKGAFWNHYYFFYHLQQLSFIPKSIPHLEQLFTRV